MLYAAVVYTMCMYVLSANLMLQHDGVKSLCEFKNLKLIILSASKLPSTCDAFCSRSFIMYFFLKLDY